MPHRADERGGIGRLNEHSPEPDEPKRVDSVGLRWVVLSAADAGEGWVLLASLGRLRVTRACPGALRRCPWIGCSRQSIWSRMRTLAPFDWGWGRQSCVACFSPADLSRGPLPIAWEKKETPVGTERQVMQEYLDALVKRADFPRYFTGDVVATFEGTDQRADGRDAAGQLIRYVHEGAFDARMELKNLLADEGRRQLRRTSPAPIPASSPGSSPRAGRSGSRTRSSTICAVIRSAPCASTSR